ncbi:MAG: hypothetical protein AAFP84_05335 [Actinomycetota bacterium]
MPATVRRVGAVCISEPGGVLVAFGAAAALVPGVTVATSSDDTLLPGLAAPASRAGGRTRTPGGAQRERTLSSRLRDTGR